MPDKRAHRGAHPEDKTLFGESQVPKLQKAVGDLSWLLGRGYTETSSLKLVGDRYALRKRQRLAVMRSACAKTAKQRRHEHRCDAVDLAGQPLLIDGYNVLTTIEAALAGCVLLVAQDGCVRDIASMHGSFRKVEETAPAAALLGQALAGLGLGDCFWFLDSPVSNSGRLKQLLEQIAAKHQWPWQVCVVPSPDKVLIETDQIVATADSVILDRCRHWFNLAYWVVGQWVPEAFMLDLSV